MCVESRRPRTRIALDSLSRFQRLGLFAFADRTHPHDGTNPGPRELGSRSLHASCENPLNNPAGFDRLQVVASSWEAKLSRSGPDVRVGCPETVSAGVYCAASLLLSMALILEHFRQCVIPRQIGSLENSPMLKAIAPAFCGQIHMAAAHAGDNSCIFRFSTRNNAPG